MIDRDEILSQDNFFLLVIKHKLKGQWISLSLLPMPIALSTHKLKTVDVQTQLSKIKMRLATSWNKQNTNMLTNFSMHRMSFYILN